MKEINNADDVHSLMGIEGNIHSVYYPAWNLIIDKILDLLNAKNIPLLTPLMH